MCNANRQNRALILGTLAMIITFMSWSSFGVLINNINLVVSMSQSQQKVLVAFPVLLGSLFRIPIGYLSDRYGGKRIYIILFLLTLLPLFTLFFIFLFSSYLPDAINFINIYRYIWCLFLGLHLIRE